MFDYECPNCGKNLEGSFGDDVTCTDCNKTFETDWDYTGFDYMSAWIVKEIEYVEK